MAHLKNLDLNLLVILESLYRHRNVTSSASELGLTQSAISHSLTHLREHYKDPLFVRVSKGVAPTEFAKKIQSEVEEFVQKAIHLIDKIETFNPKKAEGRIVIASTDYLEIVVGSLLIEKLSLEAPNIQVSFRPTMGDFPKSFLEEGVYDLAIAGFYKDLPQGFYQQKLFKDTFSTVYRKNHPHFKSGLNIDNFFKAEHILLTLQGDFKDSLFGNIAEKRKARSIKLGSSSFTAAAWIIAESDLILTGPTLLLQQFKKYFPVTIEPCPLAIKPIELQMVWHGLTNQNPLKKWVRQVIKEICSEINVLIA